MRRSPDLASLRTHLERWGVPLVAAVAVTVAAVALGRELASMQPSELAHAFGSVPPSHLAGAIGLTVVAYLVQTAYDGVTLRIVGHTLPWRRYAGWSLLAQVLGHNVGWSVLSGGSVRMRAYTSAGLSASTVAQLIALVSLGGWLGYATVTGAVLLLAPPAMGGPAWAPSSLRVVGGLAVLAPVVALGVLGVRPRWLREVPAVPGPGLGAALIGAGAMDWALTATVVSVLLPAGHGADWTVRVGCVLVAYVVGALSQSPGGLGVFEATLVLLLSPWFSAAEVLGAALVLRLVYYLGPLVIVGVGLLTRAVAPAGPAVRGLVPSLLALATFGVGAVLLVRGALPLPEAPRQALGHPLTAGWHFVASLAGTLLLVLGRGLQRRVRAAWLIAVVLLPGAAVATAVQGAIVEPVLLLGMAAVLGATRREFHRRAVLVGSPLTPGWIVASLVVIASALVLGALAHGHGAWETSTWWAVSWSDDAPRLLRTALASAVVLGALGAGWLLRPAPRAPGDELEPDDRERVMAIVASSPDTTAQLARLGDKRFLLSEDRSAFLMFATAGASWVAMGAPIGAEDAHEELVVSFLDQARRAGARPVFYEVPDTSLSVFVDLGLIPVKIGEEARVPLAGFTLEGSHRKALRYAVKRLERDGGTFEVIEPAGVRAILPELRAVSDAWLAEQPGPEKGFSLGWFEPDYLAAGRVAVVRVEGRIVAFANLWEGGDHEELSIDLMRHDDGAPHGVMDALFTSLMVWGRDQGFRWFNLGMAPLAGLAAQAGAPLLHRLGRLAFRYGHAFYHFEGLQTYKAKFEPEWRSRYLVVSHAFAIPAALVAVIGLSSRPVRTDRAPDPAT